MNKKEILEIRKQYTHEKCSISRICGCYVDGEKNIKTTLKEAFLSLPEEETFKYFNIFKQTLSGTLGKNLLNLEFPLDAENPGGPQEFLLKLRDSRLQDDALLEEFYNKIIENYYFPENYYIILIHVAYDIPGKSTDGSEMFDASDEVYEYLLCSLCPVKLSKPGLFYNTEHNQIENRIRDWVVEPPVKGFLFPAFNDRSSDIHGMLYFSKQAEELQPDFMQSMFGCPLPLTAKSQKESFNTLIADTLGEDADYEMVRNIHEQLTELVEETKDSPDPLVLTRPDVKRLFELSGVPEEKLETFDEAYDAAAGEDTALLASNIAGGRSFSIETPDIVIKVNPERTDLIETRIIDGKECLVITVNDRIEVNGVNVRTMALPQQEDEYGDTHAE
ncbi:MAG TPA: DUF4317 domain-containing protein [Candidatus Eisenbergiella stercorigallinarum]|uniref:DUF4317 domain-containing protein n=1 Tax=Candidatus Eisenbergiella stercorigallinarum TaxID=2838557 RepID=A0A9D2TZ66_9FIRM|nr:DUF4317 domain-containing protein [Candidatus Eisenbergiella stercorigallinarum]